MLRGRVRLEIFQPDKPYATGVKLYVDGDAKKITSISFTNPENAKVDFKKDCVEGGVLLWCEFMGNVDITDDEARITCLC